MKAENDYVKKGKVLISVLMSHIKIPFFVKKRLFGIFFFQVQQVHSKNRWPRSRRVYVGVK